MLLLALAVSLTLGAILIGPMIAYVCGPMPERTQNTRDADADVSVAR